MTVLVHLRAWASLVSNVVALGGGGAAVCLFIAYGVRRWREPRA